MPSAIVVGGGLAGVAAAAALGAAGIDVELVEARPFLGGRATSFPVSPSDPDSERIDNCQHVLLACFENLLDLYRRLGVSERIRFFDEIYFVEPGGRVSVLAEGRLPHFLGSFLKLDFLTAGEKFAVARGLAALERERKRRAGLDRISMLEWLEEKRQPKRAIDRFWGHLLVSAINETLDRMPASYGFQVFWTGFLARRGASRMGLAAVPLAELYDAARLPGVSVSLRTTADRFCIDGANVRGVLTGGQMRTADLYVCALPFERAAAVLPEAGVERCGFEHSPITGIHLWFEKPVMHLPHATLLDRTIQWAFNKRGGRYVQLVVSASRNLIAMPRGDIVSLACRELAEFFPRARHAAVERAHVVKEVRATFSARPGIDSTRPEQRTPFSNLFLAGDWTRTGWPATMEGAVRSGYLAAEAALASIGKSASILLGGSRI